MIISNYTCYKSQKEKFIYFVYDYTYLLVLNNYSKAGKSLYNIKRNEKEILRIFPGSKYIYFNNIQCSFSRLILSNCEKLYKENWKGKLNVFLLSSKKEGFFKNLFLTNQNMILQVLVFGNQVLAFNIIEYSSSCADIRLIFHSSMRIRNGISTGKAIIHNLIQDVKFKKFIFSEYNGLHLDFGPGYEDYKIFFMGNPRKLYRKFNFLLMDSYRNFIFDIIHILKFNLNERIKIF